MSSRQDIFQVLAEPRRREIVEMLARRGHMSSTDISDLIPVSAPAISQHLKVLREARLVAVEKKGQMRIYRLNADKLTEMEKWIEEVKSLWEMRFDQLDHVLST